MGYPVQITSKISVLQLETPYAVTKLENKTNHVCSEALFMREKLKGRISRSINLECFQSRTANRIKRSVVFCCANEGH